MISDTCYTIKSLFEDKSFNPSKVVDVSIDNSEARGKLFWKMKIRVDKDKSFFLEHIKGICDSIGHANGEGLWIEVDKKNCEVNLS